MRHWLLPILALLGLTGCTWLRQRGEDALDVLTLAAVAGGGVGVDIGPLGVGLDYFEDLAGLRGGAVGINRPLAPADGRHVQLLLLGYESTPPVAGALARGKCFTVIKAPIGIPDTETLGQVPPPFAPCWTRVEAVIGLWFGLRVGINPGELVDFLVGWTGLDLYADDLPEPAPPPARPPGTSPFAADPFAH